VIKSAAGTTLRHLRPNGSALDQRLPRLVDDIVRELSDHALGARLSRLLVQLVDRAGLEPATS
jgi:hypothetical protein